MLSNNKTLRIVVFVSLLFSFSISKSIGQIQTNNRITKEYKKFHNTFKQELKNSQDTGIFSEGLKYHISPYVLPLWFFQLPTNNKDTTFSVGISDPDLPPDIGLIQAINRAKGIATLLQNIRIRYFRNIYNSEYLANNKGEFISKFEELFQLESDLPTQKYSWNAVAIDTTKFGETVVLIKVFPVEKNSEDFLQANPYNIYCFNVEYQKSDKFEINSKVQIYKDSLFTKSKTNEFVYTWNEIGKIANIHSWIDKKDNKIEANYYKYKSSADTLSSVFNQSFGGNLMYGLWFGYINTLLKSIQNSIQPEDLLVKNVDEHYSKKFQDFSREISVIHNSIKFYKITINNNKIYINIIPNK